MTHFYNVGLLSGQRRRRCANIKPAMVECFAFTGTTAINILKEVIWITS